MQGFLFRYRFARLPGNLLLVRYGRFMKRTTIMFPDDADARLVGEARRRGVPIAEVVRDAVEHHLPPSAPGRHLPFFAIGDGPVDGGRRIDEIVGEIIVSRHTDARR